MYIWILFDVHILIVSQFFYYGSVVRSGNDGNLCAVNPIFLAIVVDYAFVVIPIKQTGRIDFQCSKVVGHSSQILDLKWNPFNDHVIASASDDCSVSKFTNHKPPTFPLSIASNLNNFV